MGIIISNKMQATPKFKFYYFDLYGRGEAIRLLMGYKKLDYEDVRVKMEDWATVKPTHGNTGMPIIEFEDGRRFNQAQTLMRWVGMKTGHYPTDPTVAFDNDRICEDWNDLIGPFGGCYFSKDEVRKEKVKVAFEKAGAFVETLKPFLEGKTSGFLFGATPYTADFWVGNFCVTYLTNTDVYTKETIDAFYAKYPWFKAYSDRIHAEFKDYLATRPKCPF